MCWELRRSARSYFKPDRGLLSGKYNLSVKARSQR
jgi:hypothetical protein